jgi:hypothetical protein
MGGRNHGGGESNNNPGGDVRFVEAVVRSCAWPISDGASSMELRFKLFQIIFVLGRRRWLRANRETLRGRTEPSIRDGSGIL